MVMLTFGTIGFRESPMMDGGDVINAGLLAAVLARRRYDPARGVSLSSFLCTRIRGAMIDRMRQLDHMTRSDRRKLRRIEVASIELRAELHREPAQDEVSFRTRITNHETRRILLRAQKPLELDTIVPFPDRPEILEQLKAGMHRPMIDLRDDVEQLLSILPARDARAMRLRFLENFSLAEVGEALGISESRACQIIREATTVLREETTAAEVQA